MCIGKNQYPHWLHVSFHFFFFSWSSSQCVQWCLLQWQTLCMRHASSGGCGADSASELLFTRWQSEAGLQNQSLQTSFKFCDGFFLWRPAWVECSSPVWLLQRVNKAPNVGEPWIPFSFQGSEIAQHCTQVPSLCLRSPPLTAKLNNRQIPWDENTQRMFSLLNTSSWALGPFSVAALTK